MLFLYGSPELSSSESDKTLSVSGLFLITMYLVSDSFTSNWQNKVIKDTSTGGRIGSFKMMCGQSLFSSILALMSLSLQQGSLYNSFNFIFQFPQFAFDCLMMSICSAVGQIFIFKTIDIFEPVTLQFIGIVRQVLGILISCYKYGHVITGIGIIGILVVFLPLLLIALNAYLKEERDSKDEEIV